MRTRAQAAEVLKHGVIKTPSKNTTVDGQSAVAVAERCNDAFAFDRYRSWTSLAKMLAGRGYNAREIEAILRSKWTRWAADSSDRPYGKATAIDLASMLDVYEHFEAMQPGGRELTEPVRGTLGSNEEPDFMDWHHAMEAARDIREYIVNMESERLHAVLGYGGTEFINEVARRIAKHMGAQHY